MYLPVVDMNKNDFDNLGEIKIHQEAYYSYITKFMRDNYKVNENSYHYAIKRAESDLNE